MQAAIKLAAQLSERDRLDPAMAALPSGIDLATGYRQLDDLYLDVGARGPAQLVGECVSGEALVAHAEARDRFDHRPDCVRARGPRQHRTRACPHSIPPRC